MATLSSSNSFLHRHVGPGEAETKTMLGTMGHDSLDTFIDDVIPEIIRMQGNLNLSPALSESEILIKAKSIFSKNKVYRSVIGQGYHGTKLPSLILRNILENPGWYTQYTPYQAEISQGRLEALLNFQTMVLDLTAMDIANSSLLDEATAAAEAMGMFFSAHRQKRKIFFVSKHCHPQTIAVVQTRAEPLNIEVKIGDEDTFKFSDEVFGALLQYPTTDGAVKDYSDFCARAKAAQAYVTVAADLMSLLLLTPPGEFGADAVVGNTQRFGVPLGFGGPHAAFLATRDQFKRSMAGRVIGVSEDAQGNPALRMALQTREQHIRREKATSNICTAQVLLAIMASMYTVYHGPEGLRQIALDIHHLAKTLVAGLKKLGFKLAHDDFFDTIKINSSDAALILKRAVAKKINLRSYADGFGIALDEISTLDEVESLLKICAGQEKLSFSVLDLLAEQTEGYSGNMQRETEYLQHPVFNNYHSETEMLRYMRSLELKDLSLAQSMIPLGSCTMKLNATTEMLPVSWPEIGNLHPFAPIDQSVGYQEMFTELEKWLAEITGFVAISLQPNSGAQGEYTGLLVIRAYHKSQGNGHRNVCLIPASAHGTNPASAVMAGMKVVVVKCDDHGNIDVEDLRAKAEEANNSLAALMVTYPSTHGVFENRIKEICDIIHQNGGQVYMDGANMNAQVGLCKPAELGADVLHLNLHKTFSIPHGGGGPGVGPIGVVEHLVPFLPGHPEVKVGGDQAIGPVAAAPWGSSSIYPVSWSYIAMMGAEGLTEATKIAILNANYMAKRLAKDFHILYTGNNGWAAHEFIVDLREFKHSAGIEAEDVAKRLMDYGFHAPTLSFPVAGTLMIEPTESEAKEELDRLCDALISIREEIREIEEGKADKADNILKNAPHTAHVITADEWTHPYSREKAAYPTAWTRARKFWPSVGRVNNALGDRNLICACPPVEDYEE
ncbi:MAG: glycine dehydrogenase (aminomethyl-transferring) [Calditrichaeota bacterium]|nr:MAG: glycine dehydrogenase (aminomethyl-transferring) [Calditrichota bacterium]